MTNEKSANIAKKVLKVLGIEETDPEFMLLLNKLIGYVKAELEKDLKLELKVNLIDETVMMETCKQKNFNGLLIIGMRETPNKQMKLQTIQYGVDRTDAEIMRRMGQSFIQMVTDRAVQENQSKIVMN